MRISDWSSDVCSSDLPIYINLAPNYDMTLEPRLMTKRGLMLNTEFRYLTPTGRGKFDFGYLPSDDLTSRDRDEELAEFIEERYPLENRRKDDRGRDRKSQRLNSSH